MHKRLSLVIAFVCIILPPVTLAQSNYRMPGAVDLDPIVRRSFRQFYVRPYPGAVRQRLYTEGFFPIGWSRDGKFAYYLEPVDEECGCYYAELIIIDLRTDKILFQFKNNPHDRVDEKGVPIADDMQKLWKRNEAMFVEKLREHNIEQTARFTLMPTTFRSGGKAYTAKVNAIKVNDEDGRNRVRKLSLDLSSPTLGKKSLFASEYKGEELWGSPLDAAAAGVFKSPFENRAAVVMVRVQRGWEGPPHTADVQIAGADLSSGFKKF